jgi:glycosyltransferase involved in cell wall biosynthesis
MTRILMTLDAVGGVWSYALDLARAARPLGHAFVFAGQGPVPTPEQRAEAEALGPLEWGGAPLDWMAPGPEALVQVPRWLDGLADRHAVDLLHLNIPSQALGLRGGRPVVVASHSCLATWFLAVKRTAPPPALLWHSRLTARGLALADAAVAPSLSHARLLEQVYGIGGIRVVPNASRSPERDWSDGREVVAVARWWDAGKNGALLDAAAAGTRARVVMIGPASGPEGTRLPLNAAIACGPLSHSETLRRLGEARLFVSPSRYEPFGLAALEAARASRPLLLAEIPTYREVWDGAAEFFDPEDAGGLAAHIDDLAADPARRARLGRAANARARAYGPERQGEAMAAIWAGAVGRAKEAV